MIIIDGRPMDMNMAAFSNLEEILVQVIKDDYLEKRDRPTPPPENVPEGATKTALVRERKPRHIVEVGSGHSTRLLSKALGGVGEILAIDPAPRADIADLPIHRTTKLVSLLCQHLVEKKVISERTVDTLMAEALR